MILSLDVEGTLVKSFADATPRNHLREFLEWADKAFDEVVVFTCLNRARWDSVVAGLMESGHAPDFLPFLRHVKAKRGEKDLRRIGRDVIHVDDDGDMALPGQKDRQWLVVDPQPDENDDVLLAVKAVLEDILSGK